MKVQRLRKESGFSLVELLVAMAMSVIVLGAVYSLYTHFIRTSTGEDKLVEIQQEGRAAVERLSKEVRAAGCYYRNTPIITATSDNFEFESDLDPDPSLGPWKINYTLDTTNHELDRSSAAWTGSAYGAYSAAQVVAAHVTGLVFSYYDESGALIATPITSQANRDRIRRVDIAVTTTTDELNPLTKKYDSVTLTTSLYLRCMGVKQSTDTTECALPSNLVVTDPGICGRLNLTWTKSTSADAAGYQIYYRPTGTSFYSGRQDVAGGSTEAYTLTGLKNGVQYDIAMKCYDTSGNINATYEGPVSGTSSPADTEPDDSVAPELPTATDATAAESAVTLTWTPSISVDTGGYDIYRSDDGGTTYTKLTGVDSTYSSYADTSVTNCPTQPFYYKVMSWDCAANEKPLTDQSAVYGDAALVGGVTDVPTNGTTNTYPTETTPPSDPVNFMATAGADKIYLSYTTPSDSDLKGVRILRREDQFPTDYSDTTAVGPNSTKDYDPLNANQTYSLIDSSGVTVGNTYYYRAFAYDNCMNYSAGTISQATAKPCGDGVPGSKHYGPPSAPTGITPDVCSTASLSWTASAGSENGNTFNPASENDVVGYNVYRSTTSGGPYAQLNATPVTSVSYADSTVTTGNTYYYVIKAVDCANNESTIASSEATVIPSGLDWDPSVTVVTSGSSGVSGSQHNIVKFGIENLGNSSVTINSATMTWTAAAAEIKSVKLKPYGGSDTTIWNDTTLPLTASGVNIDYSSYEPTASLRRLSAGSTLNEMTLEFRDSSDSAAVDLRGATINVTVYYTNDSSGSTCTSSTFSFSVPSGPVISSSTQTEPVSPTTSNLNTGTVVVPAGTQDAAYAWTLKTVTVDTKITPESGTTLSSQKLYYQTTSRSTTTAPSTDYSSAPSGWTVLDMCQVGTSDVYENTSSGSCTSSAIPGSPGKRFWYYVKATDSNANYDIQPEPTVGVYNYDQDARFKTRLWSGRFSDAALTTWGGNGKYVRIWAYMTDQDSVASTCAGNTTRSITITGGGGTTETGTMVDYYALYGTSPGWYFYDATQSYSDQSINVSVTMGKSGFTNASCGDTGIVKGLTTWQIKDCN